MNLIPKIMAFDVVDVTGEPLPADLDELIKSSEELDTKLLATADRVSEKWEESTAAIQSVIDGRRARIEQVSGYNDVEALLTAKVVALALITKIQKGSLSIDEAKPKLLGIFDVLLEKHDIN